MASSTSTAGPILTPEQVSELLIGPVQHLSIAAQVARFIAISSHELRIPVVSADPTAQWVAEGAEIAPSDAALAEVTVIPSKVAGLSIITRELADDSTPEAAEVVGDGLARDIARRVDQAFFGNVAAPAPSGLGALTGTTTVAAPVDWTNADPFAEAVYAAEAVNAALGAYVANPSDALALAQVKESSGSNKALLSPDATQAGRRTIGGVPLLTSPYVTEGTVWGLDSSRALLVVRDDAEVVADRSVFFTSDRVAVRATMRVGFGFPHAAAVVKIVRSVLWTASTAYTLGTMVSLSGGEVLEVTTAGTSGTTEPAAPAAVGGTVTNGTVVFTRRS